MTQVDAKTAVRHLQRKANELVILHQDAADETIISSMILSLRDDIDDLARQLDLQRQSKPNCRPATKEELAALCAASNVVAFLPAA